MNSELEELKKENAALERENLILEAKIEKLEKKLAKLDYVPNEIKYIIDTYGDLWPKFLEVCNNFGVVVRAPSRAAKEIRIHLEGDRYNKPLSTPERFRNYLDFLSMFTKNEYYRIQYAIALRSPEAIIFEHDRIITQLRKQVPEKYIQFLNSLK